jgi:hypothetical protein
MHRAINSARSFTAFGPTLTVTTHPDKLQVTCNRNYHATDHQPNHIHFSRPKEAQMKLAEALALRKSQETMLANLARQIESTAYDPEAKPSCNETVAAYLTLTTEHDSLIDRINQANERIVLEGEGSLSLVRIKRDGYLKTVSNLSRLLALRPRQTYETFVQPRLLDVAKLRNVLDDFARQARELDGKLQQANWLNDL